ncbi:hypothetical protein [Empedobacter sp. 189-2]|uniref:hypothetical protein n=1 Tax=Empedobacter sp. 189-2 TaxID=2746724 RepID=UPI0025749649|nr:hypothetical protein [Empedobacter sp. 189-2]MDM1542356.1 hypothetical protein [Empedobacter sp. 189-2]
MTELYINSLKVDFDVKDNKDFEYSIQVHDLASVESVNASYTTSFKIPKTKRNVEIFKSLGLTGAISNIPYKKTSAKLVVDGVTLISDGWLRVNSTDNDSFNVNIENGILDFFAKIANKNIGEEVELKELDHEKNIDAVLSSFDLSKPYLYVVADYNGLSKITRQNTDYLNADYLTPSAKVSWLWSKIFNTFGYTYSGSIFDSEDFTKLYMTYPKSPAIKGDEEEIDPVLIATLNITKPVYYQTDNWGDTELNIKLPLNIVSGATQLDEYYFSVDKDGTYRFTYYDMLGEDEYDYEDPTDQRDPRRKYNSNLVLNLDSFYGATSNTARLSARTNSEIKTRSFDIPLRAGERVGFKYLIYELNYPSWGFNHIELENLDLKIEQVSTSQISFSEELTKFSVTDFFKEILWRFGLTPIINNETKNIHFLTLNERLNSTQVVDWSSKYISRKSEEYELGNYAQKNVFKHKYNDSNAKYNDGAISVLNENLEESKDLVTSKVYTNDNSLTTIMTGVAESSVYPIWQQDIKEEKDDTGITKIKIEYKELNDRYYFIKSKQVDQSLNIGSPTFQIYTSSTSYPFVDSIDTTYRELTPKYYSNFEKIANNAIIHTISLALTPLDIANISLQSLVYFKQESAYYLLNSLKYKPNGESEGEFIKIHK